MGANVRVFLPTDVRLRDVADVLGILAGLPAIYQKLPGQAEHISVPDTQVESGSSPEMARITLSGKMVDCYTQHVAYFHYELGVAFPWPAFLVTMYSTAFWRAVSRRLVEFFGGAVDYDDSDKVEIDFVAPRPRPINNPNDGEPWQRFQQDKLGLRPVSKRELANLSWRNGNENKN